MKAKINWLLTIGLLCFSGSVFGQNSGSISGTAQDSSGAVIPAVTINAKNTATGVVSETSSLSDGKFVFSSLPPGSYEISAEKEGFKRFQSSAVEVHVSDKLSLNISMQLGETRETVTVTAEAAPIRTEDAQTGEVINNNFIRNMPQLNRNPMALLSLSGNVAGSTTTNASGQNSVQINGGRTSGIDYYVDGAVVNSGQSNAISNQTPSMDAVAEFKVVTSGISAEFGRISGGYITLVTKSGTNSYHGSVYEYMFNDMANANAWGQNAIGNPKTHFRQNNYGFTLGGPLSIPKIYDGKNRTFFFVDNEYLKKTTAGSLTLAGIPNADEMAGDLSKTIYQNKVYLAYDQYGRQVYNEKDKAWEKLDLLGGDGRHVPASRIAPQAVAIMKYLPKSNRPSQAGSTSLNNYGFASSNVLYNFRMGARLDHNISQNHRLQISWRGFDSNSASTPTMENKLYTSNVNESNGGLNTSVNYNWIARPTLLVDFRGSVTHNPNVNGATHVPGAIDNSFMPSAYQYYLGKDETPPFNVSFMNGTAYGQGASNAITNSTTYNFAATVTKILSRHTLKFGGEQRRYYDNFTNVGTANIMNWMVDPTYRLAGEWGNGFIDGRVLGLPTFLLGINNRNNVAKPTTRSMNTNYVGAFIQDDWKVSQKLTINLGFRWDNERPTTERNNNLFFWDSEHKPMFVTNPGYVWADAAKAAGLPADAPVPPWVTKGYENGAMMIAGTSEFPGRSPQFAKNFLYSPRIGFAYQLDKATVIRAYGGKMWLPTTGNPNAYATTNNSVALSDQAIAGWHSSDDGYKTFNSTWTNPWPQPAMISKFSRDVRTVNLQSSGDPGSTALNRGMSMPREYDWSVNVQRQLPAKMLVEVGYNGNRGLGLLATEIISHYPEQYFTPKYASMMQLFVDSPNAGQTLEGIITGKKQMLGLLEYKYPYYGRVAITGSNQGMSTYHAMTTRVERRFSGGFSALFNYTLSRLLDDVGGSDGQGGKSIQSIDNFHKAWGLSPLDRTHRVNLAYTYELPFGKGRHWMGSPNGFVKNVVDGVVGGWTVAGNWSYYSGQPVNLSSNNTNNINNNIKVTTTWPSYATSDHNILSPTFTDFRKILFSSADPLTNVTSRYFDSSKVVTAQVFVSGNLPPTDGNYRDPSFRQMDLSLSKSFRFGESRLFQIRGEAQNAFNFRGFGGINSQIGSPTYGLITTAGNGPRQIQVSARINF